MIGAKPLVLIVGPTGSGKSSLALELAQRFKGAILNCDSLQTYKRLDIGTAKPTKQEQKQVPHFLFDVMEPGEVLTAGDYRRLALTQLERELPERIVFGVGGSGFYIQALEKGMFDVPKPRPEVERQVREDAARLGLAHMFTELTRLDPEYADRISPNDFYRILRALIIRDSGKTVSGVRQDFQVEEFPFPLLKMGISMVREELLPRVQARAASMLSNGLLDEVRGLIRDGYRDWPALQSVGYHECLAYLDGKIPESKLQPLIVEKTMQLAKKQRTWFKRDSQIHWLSQADIISEAEGILARFLDTLK